MSCKMMLMSALPSQISKSSGLGTFHPSERARWSAAAPAHPLPQAGEGKRQRRGGWITRLSAFPFLLFVVVPQSMIEPKPVPPPVQA